MSRRYADPVEVDRRDETPVSFRWRERTFTVREVLAHWVEAGGWWLTADPSADPSTQPGAGPHGTVGGALDDEEREFWRVLTTAGGGPGLVLDLCFDWTSGRWSLVRTHD